MDLDAMNDKEAIRKEEGRALEWEKCRLAPTEKHLVSKPSRLHSSSPPEMTHRHHDPAQGLCECRQLTNTSKHKGERETDIAQEIEFYETLSNAW